MMTALDAKEGSGGCTPPLIGGFTEATNQKVSLFGIQWRYHWYTLVSIHGIFKVAASSVAMMAPAAATSTTA